MKIINDNELQMMEKQAQSQNARVKEINAFQDYRRQLETDETKRLREKTEREERIKKLLNRNSHQTVETSALLETEIDKKTKEIAERKEMVERVNA